MSAHHQAIEHVVLLNVKPDVDSTKVATMIDEINGLASLNLTFHLTIGKLLRCTSASLNCSFSHMVHCRFGSKDDLQAYNHHPDHLRVLKIVQPVIDDSMIVDWTSDGISESVKPGSVMRVTLLKLKEDLVEDEKGKLVEGIKSRLKTAQQISIGENFSHEMAKGYSIAVLAVFPDLEALDSDANLQESKVTDLIESEVVVDCVIP